MKFHRQTASDIYEKVLPPPLKLKRRKKTHPTKWSWGARKGRPWDDIDVHCARMLRQWGLDNATIAEALGRSEWAVIGKIGYVGHQPYAKAA